MTTKAPPTYAHGEVTRVSRNGLQLNNVDTWYNLSKFSDPSVTLPERGAIVRVTLSGGTWIERIEHDTATAMQQVVAQHPPVDLRGRTDATVTNRIRALELAERIAGETHGETDYLEHIMSIASVILGWAGDERHAQAWVTFQQYGAKHSDAATS